MDDVYRLVGDGPAPVVTTDRAFLLFAAEVGRHFDRFVVVGRATSDGTRAEYALPAATRLVPLPHYASLRDLRGLLRALAGSIRGFWRAAAEVDVLWAFGPHPLQLLFVGIARLRGRRVVLGVRQDTQAYFRARLPGRGWEPALVLVGALDRAHRLLGRVLPVTAVGATLARAYDGNRVLPMTVTLVRQEDLASTPTAAPQRGTVELLTVGRLEPEKNPLLLVAALAELERRHPGRFRLVWVGRGELREQVETEIRRLGLTDRVDLRGYVTFGPPLLDLYRKADVFVHVASTEGVPQVLLEAFAVGTPVVATDVGGVAEATGFGRAAALVPPADAQALAAAIEQLVADPETAVCQAREGLRIARDLTLEREAARVAAFLRD